MIMIKLKAQVNQKLKIDTIRNTHEENHEERFRTLNQLISIVPSAKPI